MRKFIFNGMNIGYTAPDRAQDVSYDNTSSGLSSGTTQAAIDELTTVVNGKANDTTSFTEASTRENIASGESHSTIFGKIKKFFSDLKTVAFSGSYNDLSDKPSIPAAVAVKGNSESSYRTGNVNLTAANIGAVSTADRGETVIKADKNASHTTAMAGYWAAMLNSSSTGSPVLPTSGKWWHVLSMDWSGTSVTSWISQLALPTSDGDGHLYHRTNKNTSTSIDSAGWTKVANVADIPSVGNGTITIQSNGTTKGSFTVNQTGNTTINVPDTNTNTVTSFTTAEFSFSVSLSAGGAKDYYVSIAKSGWTPIGIVGLYTGHIEIYPLYWVLIGSANQARVDLKNRSTGTASGTGKVTILYYKNS